MCPEDPQIKGQDRTKLVFSWLWKVHSQPWLGVLPQNPPSLLGTRKAVAKALQPRSVLWVYVLFCTCLINQTKPSLLRKSFMDMTLKVTFWPSSSCLPEVLQDWLDYTCAASSGSAVSGCQSEMLVWALSIPWWPQLHSFCFGPGSVWGVPSLCTRLETFIAASVPSKCLQCASTWRTFSSKKSNLKYYLRWES